MPSRSLEEARAAYRRCDWRLAYERFREATVDGAIGTQDLAALADAAWWLGRTDESLALSEEVYRRHLQGDEVPSAARLAVEVGFLWFLRGEPTVGSGWVSRATRLLRDAPECAEHGYLGYLEVLESMDAGRFAQAAALARDIQQLAERHDDATLHAVALALEGVSTVRDGDVDGGLLLLDEAMLAVRVGSVAPNWAGNIYCQLMGLFVELADIVRAREWTDATERWCDEHNNPAMFVGICRVHRAQLLHVEGAWPDAERCAALACRDLADSNVGVVAEGWYQIGQLRRVQGDAEGAESSFATAHELGRDPQPGLALLRLVQGRAEEADAGLRAALASVRQPLDRVPLLVARIEVAEAAADADLAAEVAGELTTIADVFGTPGLVAAARQAEGTARLVAGDAWAALPPLRDAVLRWRHLGARYDVARARVRLARALATVGDAAAADRELATAAAVLRELGARHDLDRLAARPGPASGESGLSRRELEVLALVAAGASNAAIADELTISRRTVERHVSNIFAKLSVTSRTEAARYAFVHGLVAG